MATIPANNNTGLYNTTGAPATTGNDLTVTGNVNANNINAVNTVNAGTNVNATGNVNAGSYINASYGTITNDLTVGGTIYGTFSGNIAGNLVVPGSNTQVLFNNSGNAGASADFTFNNATKVLDVNGNVVADYFIGNGSLLTGLPASYSNANVATYLASGTNSSNIITTGNVSGTYVLGNGSQLTGLPATYGNANVTTLLAGFGANTISTTGNITGGYFVGNGSLLTGISGSGNYSNSNVVSLLSAFGSNTISTTGNITGGNLIGTSAALTSLSTSGNVTVGGSLNSDDITSTGNVTVNGNQIITGNLTVQGTTTTINSNTITTNDKTITVANNQSTGANVDGAGLEAGNPAIATWLYNNATNTWKSSIGVSAVGNITGSYIFGNGSQLTGLPAGYSNADVATLLASFGSNTISTSGNITGGNIIGNGQSLTNLPAANIVGTVANATYATSAGTATSATTAGTVTTAAQPNITSVGTLTSLTSTGNISTTGNITGGYLFGNGSQLTGVISSYGNSNVTTLLAGLGSNVISSTGNITTTANVSAGYVIGNGSALSSITGANITGTVANATYATNAGTASIATTAYSVNAANVVGTVANATYATTAGTATSATTAGTATYVTAAAQANITSVGTLTSLAVTGNITSGNISATGQVVAGGNISGNYLLGNISGATGGYSNAIAAAYLASGTNSSNIITTGNVTANYINTSGVSGNITGANYITANYFTGNGSLLTGVTSSPSGNLSGDLNGGNIYSLNFMKDLVLSGNISNPSGSTVVIEGITTTGVINSTGNISTTGNVTGGYILGNGSQLTGVTATANLAGSLSGNIDTGSYYIQRAGGSTLMGNVWVTGTFAANSISSPAGNFVDIEGITTTNGMVSQGNVTAANLIANTGVFTGTLAATNLVANTQIGNLLFLNQQIQTTQSSNVALTTGILPNQGRIVVGSGYNGNTSPAYDITNAGRGARFLVSDTVGITDANSVIRGSAVQNFYTLNANITGTNTRLNSAGSYVQIGGGSAANTMSGSIFNLVAGIDSLVIGGGTSGNLTGLGNTTVQYGVSDASLITVSAGSTGGNVFGKFSQLSIAGTANTVVFAGAQFAGTGTYSGNAFVYYNPSNTNNIGLSHSNTARNATNYYAFYNDDDVAQMKLGSVRQFHEYQYALSSSAGALTVSKTNGQVQFLSVSEAITSVTFSNFVTSASTGSTTKYQTDTVTLIVQQDGTGRTITMPTPSSVYKYAAGANTIPTTASSVSMVSITALYNTVNAAVQYLITISPEFN